MKKFSIVEGDSHGGGPVVFSWQPGGNYLATAGKNGIVHVFNRHGQNVDDIVIQSETGGVSHILSLEWNCSGEVLAILSEGNTAICMWKTSCRSKTKFDTKMPDPCFMVWSRKGSRLTVGNEHGNFLIYNHLTQKKVSILGKNCQRITCGAWGKGNMLALGSEDGTITLSNEVGDTLEHAEVKYSPMELHFSGNDGRNNSGGVSETFLSVGTGRRSLVLCKVGDLDSKIELKFQRIYGAIVCHMWLDNNLIAIGFRKGYVSIISTHANEIGKEQFSGRFDEKRLISASYSGVRNCLAMVGERGLKILDIQTYKEIENGAMTLGSQNLPPTGLTWNHNGTILTIAVANGSLYNFIDRPQQRMLHASYGTCLAYLSNDREVNVVDGAHTNSSISPRSITIPLLIDPTFLALGTTHIAVGANSHVLYYRTQLHNRMCTREKTYLGDVEDIRLNSKYVAVLCGGKVILHVIEVEEDVTTSEEKNASVSAAGTPSEQIIFSPDSLNGVITAISLMKNLLAYGTTAGEIKLFHLQEWCELSCVSIPHFKFIRSLCPNYLGIRQLVIDDAGMGYIFSPATGSVVTIPEFPASADVTFWDQQDRHVFFIADDEGYLHTYAYTSLGIHGETVTKLGKTEVAQGGSISIISEPTIMPIGHKPILSTGGTVTCQVDDGTLASFVAAPYADIQQSMNSNASLSTRRACVLQNLALLRLQHAWRSVVKCDERTLYVALGNRALELFGNFSKAQELFLESSSPKAALMMRRHLLQWDQALILAKKLDSQSCAEISAELGYQLESCGEYERALRAYEDSLQGKFSTLDCNLLPKEELKEHFVELHNRFLPVVVGLSEEQISSCMAGVARCSLWLGNVHRGIQIAETLQSEQLIKECAKILEALKQTSEAAALWETVNQPERAAMIYIRMKKIDKATSVMHSVTRPKLLVQYGKACESMERWQEAANAYERAGQMDNVVRLYLTKLSEPDRACRIVRETLSITGALMVTSYYEQRQKWRETIEFFIMAKCSDKALELAIHENEMETFTDIVGDSITPECAATVAQYYETLQVDILKAGKFYSLCGQYHRALSLFLQCGRDKHVLDAAISVVGKARNDKLTSMLTDFLMGETDGVLKDPNYIYKLHMALENHTEAGKMAMAIAIEQQKLGNYKVAHRSLYETIRQLEARHVNVPQSMRQKFVLIHSYMLTKSLVRRGDHEGAASMLIRVAKNVSEFPNHIVPILTSTVIECQRAGLKKSAFEHASILTCPEYRPRIDKKIKRDIESIVRHPILNQIPELLTQCPISGELIPATQLECPTSRDTVLPMCSITGRHMEHGDWCVCPASGMPALMSHYQEFLRWESMNNAPEPITIRTTTGGINRAPEDHEGGCGHDPILGKLVYSSELRRCSSSEITEVLNRYSRQDGGIKDEDYMESPSGGPTEPPSMAFAD